MKITFVTPHVGRKSSKEYVRTWQMEPLTIATLAGLTPSDVEFTYFDERVERINFDEPTDLAAITVSWSSPGAGDRFNTYVVFQDGSMKPWIQNSGAGSAVFHGKPGQRYWFWTSVTTNLGWTDESGSAVIAVPALNHGQVQ